MSLGVKEIATATGLSRHTVRYYVRRGLLAPRQNARNRYREFAPADTQALAFIRRAQALGFTLAEIATILKMSRRRESPCPLVREIVSRRVGEIAVRMRDMRALYRRMERALAEWERMPDSVPDGHEICRLIESVALEGGVAPGEGALPRGFETGRSASTGRGRRRTAAR